MEFAGMTYEGAINNALDQEVKTDLDKSLADKDENQLTDDERKVPETQERKEVLHAECTLHESEMQDIVTRCEQYGYKNKTEYIRDCVRARVDLTPDRTEIAENQRADETHRNEHQSDTCPTLQHRSHLCRGY